MRALVFAAGLGTRLKPFTDSAPKALAPVGGKPIVAHVIEKLVKAGVDTLVINVHHFADMVIDYVNSHDFGAKIIISDERDLLLDTGGGLLKAAELLDAGDGEPFIVHNADILTDFDIRQMVKSHIDSGADVTLLATHRDTARYFFFDRASRGLVGWSNIKTGECRPDTFRPDDSMEMLAFGGVHVISPSVLKRLKTFATEPKFSIVPFYIGECHDLDIKCWHPEGEFHWLDIGNPDNLRRANELISEIKP
jgi:NDP-sugar pyrophosphorylase family protein